VSAARDKGTRAETAVVHYLRDFFRPWMPDVAAGIGRHPLNGAVDLGDIRGVPCTVLQVKNTQRLDLAGAVDAARLQAANAEDDIYAAWIKRRGTTDPARWYFVTDGEIGARLLHSYVLHHVGRCADG
jgi:hypothetical protein